MFFLLLKLTLSFLNGSDQFSQLIRVSVQPRYFSCMSIILMLIFTEFHLAYPQRVLGALCCLMVFALLVSFMTPLESAVAFIHFCPPEHMWCPFTLPGWAPHWI